jgi:membrane-associated phospholipid phosphatase
MSSPATVPNVSTGRGSTGSSPTGGVRSSGCRGFLNDGASVVVILALAVGVGVVLWRIGQPLFIAIVPTLAVASSGLCAAVLKSVVGRARPAATLRLVTETEPSFPSGHSTSAMAFGLSVALVLAIFVVRGKTARLLALGVGAAAPVLVGASRLELGVHWPTDVIAGLALGACAALAVTGVAIWVVHQAPQPDARSHSTVTGRVAALLRRRRRIGTTPARGASRLSSAC